MRVPQGHHQQHQQYIRQSDQKKGYIADITMTANRAHKMRMNFSSRTSLKFGSSTHLLNDSDRNITDEEGAAEESVAFNKRRNYSEKEGKDRSNADKNGGGSIEKKSAKEVVESVPHRRKDCELLSFCFSSFLMNGGVVNPDQELRLPPPFLSSPDPKQQTGSWVRNNNPLVQVMMAVRDSDLNDYGIAGHELLEAMNAASVAIANASVLLAAECSHPTDAISMTIPTNHTDGEEGRDWSQWSGGKTSISGGGDSGAAPSNIREGCIASSFINANEYSGEGVYSKAWKTAISLLATSVISSQDITSNQAVSYTMAGEAVAIDGSFIEVKNNRTNDGSRRFLTDQSPNELEEAVVLKAFYPASSVLTDTPQCSVMLMPDGGGTGYYANGQIAFTLYLDDDGGRWITVLNKTEGGLEQSVLGIFAPGNRGALYSVQKTLRMHYTDEGAILFGGNSQTLNTSVRWQWRQQGNNPTIININDELRVRFVAQNSIYFIFKWGLSKIDQIKINVASARNSGHPIKVYAFKSHYSICNDYYDPDLRALNTRIQLLLTKMNPGYRNVPVSGHLSRPHTSMGSSLTDRLLDEDSELRTTVPGQDFPGFLKGVSRIRVRPKTAGSTIGVVHPPFRCGKPPSPVVLTLDSPILPIFTAWGNSGGGREAVSEYGIALSSSRPHTGNRSMNSEPKTLSSSNVRLIPYVTDDDFSDVVRSFSSSDQLLVVLIVVRGDPPFRIERYLERAHIKHCKPRSSFGNVSNPPVFHIVKYAVTMPELPSDATEIIGKSTMSSRQLLKDLPLLQRRHSVSAGMVLFYFHGRLVFANTKFAGIGRSEASFRKQVDISLDAGDNATFLDDFHFHFRVADVAREEEFLPLPHSHGSFVDTPRVTSVTYVGGYSQFTTEKANRTPPNFSPNRPASKVSRKLYVPTENSSLTSDDRAQRLIVSQHKVSLDLVEAACLSAVESRSSSRLANSNSRPTTVDIPSTEHVDASTAAANSGRIMRMPSARIRRTSVNRMASLT